MSQPVLSGGVRLSRRKREREREKRETMSDRQCELLAITFFERTTLTWRWPLRHPFGTVRYPLAPSSPVSPRG